MSTTSGASSLAGLAGPSGDATSIASLRSAAARDPKAAIRETAKQFEALFMQQLMKSMREATMSSGMLDNSGTQLGTEMLDTQYANKMSGLPGGLAAAIARQLERQLGSGAAAALAAPAAAGAAGAATGASAASFEATPLSSRRHSRSCFPDENIERARPWTGKRLRFAAEVDALRRLPSGARVPGASAELALAWPASR